MAIALLIALYNAAGFPRRPPRGAVYFRPYGSCRLARRRDRRDRGNRTRDGLRVGAGGSASRDLRTHRSQCTRHGARPEGGRNRRHRHAVRRFGPYAAKASTQVGSETSHGMPMADGIDAIGMPCDVSDPTCVDAFAAFVIRERGVPQVLVNNAGIGRFRPLVELSLEDWDETMGVNVRSLYLVTRAFLKGMLDAATGTIVNIASLAGKNGVEGGTAYCASKHAVLGCAV